MAEKTLYSRIQLKGDSYSNWTTQDPVLLKNEVAIVTIANEDGAPVNKPGVYFKVGDGTSTFSQLGFTSGIAGDVYAWAKAENKPTYAASEIQGLEDFISGEIQDTNTTYQIVQDVDNPRKFTLQSKGIGEEAWSDVTSVTIPAQTLVEGTANGTVKFDGTDIKVHGLGSAAYTESTAYATAAQGAAADTALQPADITTGATNGTISVDGTEVSVYGLKSAAYAETTAFDAAGAAATAKSEVIGTNDDLSSADTIKAAKKYTDEQIAAIPEVEVPEYTIAKESTAENGYAASYVLQKDGAQVGVKINIPKDYLVKSASIKESIGEGDASELPAGTKYIDFVVNTTEGTGNESHIYLNVNELVDAYTAGNGVEVSVGNVISAKVVAANGLSVDASGIQLALATTATAGAMSAADKTKLDGLHTIATSGNINDLVQTSGDILILNCGDATV